jgi:hypothetical protein
MKRFNIKLLLPFLFLSVFFLSCGKEELVTYGDGGNVKIADAFLQIQTAVVQFQAGLPDYKLSTYLVNGEKTVTKVNVYSVYTDAKSGAKSNEALLTSFDVPAGNRVLLDKNITYADLKKGLTVNGGGLPDDQKVLPVGSGWKFRFEGETASGKVNLPGNVNVGVLSRFAGLYKVIESKYYRIGVLTADWAGQTRFIGSVDETTFSYNDFWGSFAWTGKSFNFSLNTDNSINVPIPINGIFSGTYAINCKDNKDKFGFVPCDGSNVLIPEETTGKHIIKLTYGYFTETGAVGSREFYEILEKI